MSNVMRKFFSQNGWLSLCPFFFSSILVSTINTIAVTGQVGTYIIISKTLHKIKEDTYIKLGTCRIIDYIYIIYRHGFVRSVHFLVHRPLYHIFFQDALRPQGYLSSRHLLMREPKMFGPRNNSQVYGSLVSNPILLLSKSHFTHLNEFRVNFIITF